MKKNKPTFELWEVLLITFVASLIMSVTTGYTFYKYNRGGNYSELVNNEHLGTFLNSYNSIITNYYDDVDQNALIDAAISGMLNYLDDPYTTYLNESSKDYLMESLKGTYEGVGIEINKEEGKLIQVANVFDNSPASKAGLLAGDFIKAINGVDVSEKTTTEAVEIIKGSSEKTITMDVERNGEGLTFTLNRETLYVPAVTSNTFENNNQKIGYLKVTKFSDTVGEQFKLKLDSLEETEINSLIIDLRGNTGGYLKGASDIASMFLKEKALIYSLKNKLETTKFKDKTPEAREYKVYIITNGSSASASEVLAAALKYSYSAIIVGEKSYGKGKVQQTSDLTDGSMIKYTAAQWLTPNGDCIDGVGLIPDIEVVLGAEYSENPSVETDNQLQTAIFEISK